MRLEAGDIFNIDFGSGIPQALTEEERSQGLLLRVRWRGGTHLAAARRSGRYWLGVYRDDTLFQSEWLKKETDLPEKLKRAVSRIQSGQYLKKKTTAEQVAEIVQQRQLVSCMNTTKWREFRSAMLTEMPFPPPYALKTLFDETEEDVRRFLADPAGTYLGDYSAECFAGLNEKIIEYVVVRPFYYEEQGGRLVSKHVLHDAVAEFMAILEKYHIPWEKAGDVYYIRGYR